MASTPKKFYVKDLQPGDKFVIHGKINYARLCSFIEGAELAQRIQRTTQIKGFAPANKPHTYISLNEAAVVPKIPGQLDLAEQFAQERIYRSKDGSVRFEYENYSHFLPRIFVREKNGNGNDIGQEIKLKMDPAKDLDCIVCIHVYKSKTTQTKGTSIEYILFNEPMRYRDLNVDLSAYGITETNCLPQDQTVAPSPEPAPNTNPNMSGSPFASAPTPPPAAPVGNAFSTPGYQNPPAANNRFEQGAPARPTAPPVNPNQPMNPPTNNGYAENYTGNSGQNPASGQSMPNQGSYGSPTSAPSNPTGFAGSENVSGVHYNPADRQY